MISKDSFSPKFLYTKHTKHGTRMGFKSQVNWRSFSSHTYTYTPLPTTKVSEAKENSLAHVTQQSREASGKAWSRTQKMPPGPFLGSSSLLAPNMITQWLNQSICVPTLSAEVLANNQGNANLKCTLVLFFFLRYWQIIKPFPELWVGEWCPSRLALSSPPPLCPRRQACKGYINRLLGPLSSGWGQPSRRTKRKERFEACILLAPSNGAILGWLHPSFSTWLSSLFY